METVRNAGPSAISRFAGGFILLHDRNLLRRRASPVAAVATALALAVSFVALLPLAFIIWITIQTGFETAWALVVRPRMAELFVNTLLLELLAVPISIVLAVALAWLVERTDLSGARLWSWLAVTPLAIPAFVHSYAWMSVKPSWNGLWAAVFISVLAYFPFLYLPIAAQLRRLDPGIEDAAAALGEGPWRVFFRVVVPQLRIAICGGSLLIGLHLLAEFGLYAMVRFDTLTTAIMDQFQSTFNGPAANMTAGVLVLSCLALLQLESVLRGKERYARVGSGASRMLLRRRLGWSAGPCILLPAVIAALSLGVPLITLGRWLIIGGGAVWLHSNIAAALSETLMFALAGGLIATAAAMPMAWLSVRVHGRLARFLEGCHYYTGSLPGVVVALALVAITVRLAFPLYQTVATVLLAYVLLFLPRAMVGLRSSLTQAPVELEQAAMSLGRTPLRAVIGTTFRLAAPGVAASMALVALGITTELTATLMLAPNGTRTLATEFWSLTSELDYSAAAPYALAMVLLSLPLTLLLQAQSKRMAGR
jgi:iron(III) transport system permease protein